MEKRFIIKVPPSPAVIRERSAGFFTELAEAMSYSLVSTNAGTLIVALLPAGVSPTALYLTWYVPGTRLLITVPVHAVYVLPVEGFHSIAVVVPVIRPSLFNADVGITPSSPVGADGMPESPGG